MGSGWIGAASEARFRAPLLRGEGWGEGLPPPPSSRATRRPLPASAFAPKAGFGGHERGEEIPNPQTDRFNQNASCSQAHSPFRNTGAREPSARMPSISVLSEPIIQSMWIRLLLPPCAAICSGVSLPPSTKHFE